jgi:hypothetical protein
MKNSPSTLLHWTLGQGAARIACDLDRRADRTFRLSVTPSWSRRARIVDRFTDVVEAMERHAEVTGRLRDTGWRVIDRTAAAAASQ